MILTSELSELEKKARALYLATRVELDQIMLDYSLIQSYWKYRENGLEFPFPERRILKPGARVPREEDGMFAEALIVFFESSISPELKKNIRIKRATRVTKERIKEAVLDRVLGEDFIRELESEDRYVSAEKFKGLLQKLAALDSALLIQREPTQKVKGRYILTDFFVDIEYNPIELAEILAKELRYISKSIYEKEEQPQTDMDFSESFEGKFYEFFGFSPHIGRRRKATAAAAFLLRQLGYLSTIYASSNEEKCLITAATNGISRTTLLKLDPAQARAIEENYKLSLDGYAIDQYDGHKVVMFKVEYDHTPEAKPPEDGKLREFNPAKSWLRISNQLILPKKEQRDLRPLPFHTVYEPEHPFSRS
ncbi:MAG: hypothetical protein ABIB47_03640 [Candidatus Woesearchaeota archaeon]